MKQINNNYSSLSNVVDDAQCDKDITNTFANKYKHSCNSVSYDVNDMNVVRNELEKNIASSFKTGSCKTSHHVHLALLFNAMILHGVSPNNMLLSTLVPIPKNIKKRSLNDTNNYRAIALGSIVSKVTG